MSSEQTHSLPPKLNTDDVPMCVVVAAVDDKLSLMLFCLVCTLYCAVRKSFNRFDG